MNHQPKAGSDPAEETDWMIRPAQPDDAAAVAELYGVTRRAAIPAMPTPVHGPEEDQRYFAALLAGGFDLTAAVDGTSGVGTETWVADRDGVVLGFAVLQPGWLHSLYNYFTPGAKTLDDNTLSVWLSKNSFTALTKGTKTAMIIMNTNEAPKKMGVTKEDPAELKIIVNGEKETVEEFEAKDMGVGDGQETRRQQFDAIAVAHPDGQGCRQVGKERAAAAGAPGYGDGRGAVLAFAAGRYATA